MFEKQYKASQSLAVTESGAPCRVPDCLSLASMLVGTPFLQDVQDDHMSPEIQACALAEYRTEE